jgi:lipopolysaccharide/colanic/teichoic acid biosynthesis glycosyltransferase
MRIGHGEAEFRVFKFRSMTDEGTRTDDCCRSKTKQRALHTEKHLQTRSLYELDGFLQHIAASRKKL